MPATGSGGRDGRVTVGARFRDDAAVRPGRPYPLGVSWDGGAGDRASAVPWEDMLVYETHVKRLTSRLPNVTPALRGTYLGLAHRR